MKSKVKLPYVSRYISGERLHLGWLKAEIRQFLTHF